MIISHEYKFVFMCIPKTATMMMEQILKPYGGVYKTGGRWARHPNDVPKNCKDYFTFCTARNPYSRAISLWFSAMDFSSTRDRYGVSAACGGSTELLPFLRMINTPKGFGAFGGLPLVSMSNFLCSNRIDHTMKFENLAQEVAALPFWKGDPPVFRDNVRGHLRPHWSKYCQNNEVVKLIQQWADNDFDRFGYSRDIPTDKDSLVDHAITWTSPCPCGSGKPFNKCCQPKQMDQYFANLYQQEGN